jgi:hypothetical protein
LNYIENIAGLEQNVEDCHENKKAGSLFAYFIDCFCWMFPSNKAKYANP